MKYISILRGINVSGQKKINMTELKLLYESLGFNNVLTYIQSGNVLFESVESDIQLLIKKIESAIENKYNFDVPVLIKTIDQWKSVIEDNPFQDIDPIEDGSRLLVTFFAHIPDPHLILSLDKFKAESERLKIIGNLAYLYCPDGYGKTKLSTNLLEKKLKVQATTRNWKTVLKLLDLYMENSI